MKLKIHYASKLEIEDERNKKKVKEVPSLRDFEFIKVLGTGGFATVYMGKYIWVVFDCWLTYLICFFLVRKKTCGILYAMKTVRKTSLK